jgi:hypothetical protein
MSGTMDGGTLRGERGPTGIAAEANPASGGAAGAPVRQRRHPLNSVRRLLPPPPESTDDVNGTSRDSARDGRRAG